MKREMLQKVNEAVANFRKVADQQMAEVGLLAMSFLTNDRLQKEQSEKTCQYHHS